METTSQHTHQVACYPSSPLRLYWNLSNTLVQALFYLLFVYIHSGTHTLHLQMITDILKCQRNAALRPALSLSHTNVANQKQIQYTEKMYFF